MCRLTVVGASIAATYSEPAVQTEVTYDCRAIVLVPEIVKYPFRIHAPPIPDIEAPPVPNPLVLTVAELIARDALLVTLYKRTTDNVGSIVEL